METKVSNLTSERESLVRLGEKARSGKGFSVASVMKRLRAGGNVFQDGTQLLLSLENRGNGDGDRFALGLHLCITTNGNRSLDNLVSYAYTQTPNGLQHLPIYTKDFVLWLRYERHKRSRCPYGHGGESGPIMHCNCSTCKRGRRVYEVLGVPRGRITRLTPTQLNTYYFSYLTSTFGHIYANALNNQILTSIPDDTCRRCGILNEECECSCASCGEQRNWCECDEFQSEVTDF